MLVGTGSRGSHMWGKALMQTHAEHVELVGLCDINRKRVEYARGYIGVDVPTYPAGDFDKMIHDTKPDAVMVTTPDCFHADYVVRALDLDCDAISERSSSRGPKVAPELKVIGERSKGSIVVTSMSKSPANVSCDQATTADEPVQPTAGFCSSLLRPALTATSADVSMANPSKVALRA